MNKNFKVIFNRVRGCFVVANECAKSVGKGKSIVAPATSTVVAGLFSLSLINPVLATESLNKDNIVGNGQQIQNSSLIDITTNTKLISGVDYTGDTSSDIENTNISIDIKATLDEIIGGSQARTQKDAGTNLYVGSSTVTVKDVTADRMIGGSKNANSDNVNFVTGNITSTLVDVTVNKDFVGGNLIKATGQGGGGPATSEGTTQSIENNILSGVFDGRFIGGSMAENYGNNTGTLKVSDERIVTNISGGDFSDATLVVGGAIATGKQTQATVGSSILKITGGEFSSSVRKSIYAGSVAENEGEVAHKNAHLVIDGSSGNFSQLGDSLGNQIYGMFYGGGLNSTVSETVNVSVSNMSLGFSKGNTVYRSHVYAGSSIQTSGTFEEGDTNLIVSDSHFYGDALGAGFMQATDATLNSGNASVEIINSSFDGYTDGVSRFSGRVFGAGRVESSTNSSFFVNSSTVKIHNLTGLDIEQGNGGVTHDPGSQVFGAMQVYASKNTLAHVGSTSVFVEGRNTAIAEVYGGGIISGTVKKNEGVSLLSTGESYAEVAEGNITSILAGGNATNWFGISVVGKLDEENGTFEKNGHRYSEGSSTAVLSGGGNVNSLRVVGGSTANYGSYFSENGCREAYVFGTATALIRGGSAKIVNGAGYASYSAEGEAPEETKVTDDGPISNVNGNSYAVLQAGEISSYLIGGGYSQTTHKELATVANVEGDSHVLISGGTVKDVIGAGFAEGNGATADVTGNSFVTISGGTISGNIYAGGLSENGGKANVDGTATVTFLADVEFKGTVDGSNAKTSILTFGDDGAVFNADFDGIFKNFDEVKAAHGSKVKFKEIGPDQFKTIDSTDKAKLKLTGKGVVETEKFSLSEGKTLEVLNGSFIVSSAVLNGGTLYIDPVWTEEPSLAAIEDSGEIKSQIVIGQNSALTFGSKDTQLALTALKQSGHSLSENDIKSVVYVASPIKLNGEGKILVDGKSEGRSGAVDNTSGVFVKADGALIVNGAIEGPSIIGAGNQDFVTDAGSKLIIHNAVAGKSVSIASGFRHVELEEGTSYETTNRILNLDKISVDENGEMVACVKADLSVISNVLMPNTVLAAVSGETGVGVDRINDLLSVYNGLEYAEVEKALNSIALMGVAAGAQTFAVNTADLLQDTLNFHGSKLASYSHEKAGLDLWLDVNGSFSKANDYSVGIAKYGYKSDLAGVMIGGDYTLGNGVAAGLAVSLGKGSIRGQGNGSGVKNDIDYYGINLYGVANTRFVNLIGTIGYLQSKNEIKQMVFKGKPDAKTLSLGVRAEKPLALTDRVTVTPHIGVKYVHTTLNGFSAGGLVYKADKANLVQVPFGVALNANLEAPCGAKVKPFIDLTLAPSLGDKKVSNKVGLVTTGTLDSFDARITNNVLYKGKLGLETTKGKHSFGLNYGIGGGNRGRVDQTLQANYRYQF